MSLCIVSADSLKPVRWKNGGGWTYELLTWPQPQDWLLRISVADIESDGPFSSYPDVDRYFAPLSGDGVRLAIDGEAVTLDADSSLYQFKGEADVHCRLIGGATRDFNLMLRRGRAELHWLALGEAAPLPVEAQWSGLFSVGGGSVREIGSEWQRLPEMSLAWSASNQALQSRLSGKRPRGWMMQLHMKDGRS